MFAYYATKTVGRVQGNISRRAFSNKNPLTRFDYVPTTLYRIHGTGLIKLRSYEKRIAEGMQGEFSFDFHEKNGMVSPMVGEFFTKPNGMSLRPKCDRQKELVRNYAGDKMNIFVLPVGMKIPSDLILLHEHTDHYSMQVRVPMSVNDFNKELNTMLRNLKILSKSEFLALFDEEEEEETEAFDN
jgi:hypothetical protein